MHVKSIIANGPPTGNLLHRDTITAVSVYAKRHLQLFWFSEVTNNGITFTKT